MREVITDVAKSLGQSKKGHAVNGFFGTDGWYAECLIRSIRSRNLLTASFHQKTAGCWKHPAQQVKALWARLRPLSVEVSVSPDTAEALRTGEKIEIEFSAQDPKLPEIKLYLELLFKEEPGVFVSEI